MRRRALSARPNTTRAGRVSRDVPVMLADGGPCLHRLGAAGEPARAVRRLASHAMAWHAVAAVAARSATWHAFVRRRRRGGRTCCRGCANDLALSPEDAGQHAAEEGRAPDHAAGRLPDRPPPRPPALAQPPTQGPRRKGARCRGPSSSRTPDGNELTQSVLAFPPGTCASTPAMDAVRWRGTPIGSAPN